MVVVQILWVTALSVIFHVHVTGGDVNRHLQDRGLCVRRATVGKAQELPDNELRQNESLDTPVLPQRHHSQDRLLSPTRLSVLSQVPLIQADQRYRAYIQHCKPPTSQSTIPRRPYINKSTIS